MSDLSRPVANLAPDQQAIRAKCFHPSGSFVEFGKEEIEQSIPCRFEEIVRLYSERLAVKVGNRALTYEQLNRVANRIARTILEKRGGGSEPIALVLEHGINVIAAIFAVLKAGKFYVAIDPSFPPERIALIINDSHARLIVTNGRNADLAQEHTNDDCTLVNTDEIDDSSRSNNLGLSVSPDDLVSIHYTSGSTGKPKGVIETHRNVMHSFMAGTDRMGTCADDKLTLLHYVSFGSAEFNLFQALLNGASLFPFDLKSEGIHCLARWLREEQITVYHSSPSVFRQLADSLSRQKKLPGLRLIHLSGATITERDFELYKNTFSPETLLEIGMGSTEARGICSAIVDHTFSFPKEGSPVGYPLQGKKVLLLNESGHEVGPGEVGEIAVKSCNLNPGYWKRSELTGAKFFADPSGGEERIYLTGDLGRMLPDGFLIHLGRKDSMVKVRGYRVEASEIERALLAHPQVKDAGVVAWDGEPGEKYLVAYVVRRENAVLSNGDLQEFLVGKLPDYMLPSAITFLESLPLTNGKLDRAGLPLLDHKRPDMRQAYIPPETDIEKTLVQIWEEILNVSPIGIHDNFLALGGHSLAATRVVSQVIKKFQIELPLQVLFESPTVAEMAAEITEYQGKNLDDEGLARILTELESLSDEEAQGVLARESETESTRD